MIKNEILKRAYNEHCSLKQGYPDYRFIEGLKEIDAILEKVVEFRKTFDITVEHFVDFVNKGLVTDLLPPDGDEIRYYPDDIYLDGSCWCVNIKNESTALGVIDDYLEENER